MSMPVRSSSAAPSVTSRACSKWPRRFIASRLYLRCSFYQGLEHCLPIWCLSLTEIEHIRRPRPRERDIDDLVAVHVAKGEAVRRTLLVAEGNPPELRACSVVEKDGVRAFCVSEHDVWMPIVVEIPGGHGVRRPAGVDHVKACRELSLAVIHVDRERAGGFVTNSEIDRAVPVEIRRGAHTSVRIRGAERQRSRKAGLAVVEIDSALAAVAARHREIDKAIL